MAGLIALIALTFSLAESVWASTCASGMGVAGTAVAGTAIAGTATADPAADPDCAHGGASSERKGEPAAPHCPLGAAATAQGCLAAASLPSVAIDIPVSRAAAEAGHFSHPVRHKQVSDHTLFHPPRTKS